MAVTPFLYEVLESEPSNFLKLVNRLRSSRYAMLHEYCLHKKYNFISINWHYVRETISQKHIFARHCVIMLS